ncbi:MAG: thiamine pyrophosphate-dependent enzyme [Gemmataceae bacterium]
MLFVCENNQFATEVPFAYAAGNPSVYGRGAACRLPGYQVDDGNDVQAVLQVAGEAVRRARAGEGPTLIECLTYRTRPHAEGMGDFTYRSREEVLQWKKRCPILRLQQRLVGEVKATEAELGEVEAEVQRQVEDAQKAAEAAPGPTRPPRRPTSILSRGPWGRRPSVQPRG